MNSDKEDKAKSNISFEEELKEDEKSEDQQHSSHSIRSNSNEIATKKTPNKETSLNVIMNGKKSLSFKEVTNIIPMSSHKKSLHFPKIRVPTKRLIIKEIILENFKSYQGRQVIGPFHKRFTSIVGPNGSGKSNLIESLLFVFGKKASWMRLNKLYELIHNSSHHQNLKKASVEVRFCEINDEDEEAYEIIPNSEFTVRRVVHHTSVSEYEINDDKASQKEVVDLLKSKGIDLTNHRFLILQGEVEQISLMKPKSGKQEDPGLLEYLEEIIGSCVYKEKIESMDEEYAKLYESKREKNELVSISRMELVKLESSKNLAIEYVKKEKQIYQLINIAHQIARHKANKEIMKCEGLLEETQRKKKEEEKIMKEKVKSQETLLQNYKKKKHEIEDVKDKIKALEIKITELDQKDVKLSEDMKHLLETEIKFQDKLKSLEKDYNKIIENANEIKKTLPEKKNQLSQLKAKSDLEENKLSNIMNDLNTRAEELRKKKKSIEKTLLPFQKSHASITSELDILKNKLNFLATNSSNFQEELREMHDKGGNLQSDISKTKEILSEIAKAFANLQEVKTRQQITINSCKEEEELLIREVSEIQLRLQEAQSSASEQHQKSHLLNELMKAQQKRELSGIHGRLGDLATIDEKYDIAISTSSPSLDNIVVSSFDQSIKCVDFLRNNKIGRATFISLDKVETMQNLMNRPFTPPAGTMRLFDLVKIKNEIYRAAFYFALRDTLVCENIDLATQVAFGSPRFRVVVTNGVVIEATGVMSGGGKPKKGAMAAKMMGEGLSAQQIAELNERKRSRLGELEEVRKRKAASEGDLQVILKDEAQIQKERKKYETELEFYLQQDRDHEAKSKEIQRILERQGQNEGDRKEIEKQIKEKSKELEGVEQKMRPFLEEKDGIEQKIAEIGGEELQNQQRITEETLKNYQNIEKEVMKMSSALDNTQGNIEKNEKEKQKIERNLKDVSEKIKLSKKQTEELENEALEKLGKKKAAVERLEVLETEFKKDSSEKEQTEKFVQECKQTLAKFVEKIDEIKQLLKKSHDDYNKENAEMERNRKEYKDAIVNYDFMDQIEEIESFNVSDEKERVSNANAHNESILEMSMMGPPDSFDNNLEDSTLIPKKRLKISMETKTLENIDVFNDLSMEQLDNIEKIADRLKIKISTEQEKLKGMSPNINSIVEFRNKFMEHKQKTNELENAIKTIDELKNQIESLKKTRFDEFMHGYNIINNKLGETYQLLTSGGSAELEIDSLDPFSEGVTFSVRPPKKSWKQMTKLSGGEKTLSSLALVFALHYYKPTPLYFMDEIDAALDFKNVAIVAKYIKERTKNAQFIIISLRNNMFELANKLVGVYKTFDTTKTIAITPSFFHQLSEIPS